MSNTGEASTAFELEPWLAAKQRFLDGIDDDVEKTLFDNATVENIFTSAKDANRDDASNKVRTFDTRIQPLVDAIGDFSGALDNFTSMAPLYLAPIWGSIRVILVLAKKHRKFYDRIVEVLGRIGDILPRFRDYQRIFDPQKYRRLMMALSNSYLDIILLCTRIQDLLRGQRHSKLTRVFQPLSPSANAQLDDAVATFRNHRKTVEKEAETAHMIEEAEARALVERNEKAALRQKLLSYLLAFDYEGKQRKLQKLRHPNTGSWLLTSLEYEAWLNSQKSSLLCCYGIPGCGKSVLASRIVDEFPLFMKSTPNAAIAYHYCDYVDKRTLEPANIFAALSWALLQTIDIPSEVEDLISRSYNDGMRKPDSEEVFQILHATMAAHAHIIFIIDGLDEASENDQTVVHTSLQSLLRDYSRTLRLFVSCREDVTPLIAIPSTQIYKVQIRAAAISDDIAGYVSDSIDLLLRKKHLVLRNQGLKEEVIQALVEGAKGMFLWVKFVIDDLCDAETDDEIRKILKNLPRSLAETYDRLLGRIHGENRRKSVRRIFQWIASAKRPLIVNELQEGIAFHLEDHHWDLAKVPTDMSRLIRACSKLVVVDEENGIVEFAHYTIMQYLLSTENTSASQFHFNLRDANSYVGEVCVAYLCFSDFETQIVRHTDTTTANMTKIETIIVSQSLPGPIATAMKMWHFLRGYESRSPKIDYARHFPKAKPPTTEILKKYSLLGYVIENWLWHSASFWEDPSPETSEPQLSSTTHSEVLYQIESGWRSQPQGRLHFRDLILNKRLMFDIRPWELYQASEEYPQIFTIGCALLMNHVPLLASLGGADSRLLPSRYTSLVGEHFYGATTSNFKGVSQEILDKLQESNHTNDALGWFYSKLVAASRLGHSASLKFCLYPISDAARQIRNHLLVEAAAYGQKPVVKLLCINGIVQDHFTCDFEKSSLNAIERAALGGHVQIVSYLMARGHRLLQLDLPESISRAIDQENTKVFRAFMEFPITEFKNTHNYGCRMYPHTYEETQRILLFQKAMVFAARQNDVASVSRLMKCGLSAYSTFISKSVSPLIVAMQQSQYEMISAIMAHQGLHVPRNDYIMFPILWAASTGNVNMVKFLLDRGPPTLCLQNESPSALFAAATNGHLKVVELLLKSGADPDSGCPWVFFSNRYINVQNLGIINDVMFEDQKDQISPLQAAMFNGHVEVMALLMCSESLVDLRVLRGMTNSGEIFWDSLDNMQALAITILNSNGISHRSCIFQFLISIAAHHGHAKVLENLFKSTITAAIEHSPWLTAPLLQTITKGHAKYYEILRKAGAEIKNDHPIEAIIHQRHEMLLDMLNSGLDADTRAEREPQQTEPQFLQGSPLLLIAAMVGDAEATETLLRAGAHINSVDDRGRTALLCAIENNDLGVFQVLYRFNASFSQRNEQGLVSSAMDSILDLRRGKFTEFMAREAVRAAKTNRPSPFTIEDLEKIMNDRFSHEGKSLVTIDLSINMEFWRWQLIKLRHLMHS